MGVVDGLPWPEDQDPPDGPIQIRALAEGTDLRIDNLAGTVTTTDTALQSALTALTARVTTAEQSLSTLTTNFNALKLAHDNMVAFTHIMATRIEMRTVVLTTNASGAATVTFLQPFKNPPKVVLVSGSPTGMAAANGTGWGVAGPPGPYVWDNPVPSKTNFVVNGYNKSTNFRIWYIAIGDSAFTDRTAEQGGPGFDV